MPIGRISAEAAAIHGLTRRRLKAEDDLVPSGAQRLTAPCGGQHEEFEAEPRALRDAGHAAHGVEGLADLGPWECAMVRLHRRHRGPRPVDGLPRRVGVDVAVRLAPLQRGADALAQLAGELRAGAPKRLLITYKAQPVPVDLPRPRSSWDRGLPARKRCS